MGIGQHLSRILQLYECRICILIGLTIGMTCFVGLAVMSRTSEAQGAASSELMQQHYQKEVQPLLKRLCFECHAKDVTEADIDLSAFAAMTDIQKQPKVWIKVREMLDSSQMPPKDSPQPTDAERKRLRSWVREFLTHQAKAHAGDPGPVILRRLSNDEYNYTVRDLTGVASLNPTREFPVDGAAGEGFTNTGAAQAMSPSLVTKYLDAAKEVASHAVLTPSGIRFSSSTTRRDHTDELLARIQAFYRPFTEDSGNTSVTLQGIKLSTSDGGRLPVGRYIEATLQERDAIQSGHRSLSDVARDRSLNEKYLTTLWNVLTTAGNQRSLLIDRLRESWSKASAEDATVLATEIDAAQASLWKFNSIGQAGRQGGPTLWQEPVSPLLARHHLRHRIVPTAPDSEVTLWLAVGDLADGNSEDFVVLEQPRFEFPIKEGEEPLPPIDLRDIRSLVSGIESIIASEAPRTADYLMTVTKLLTSKQSLEEAAKAQNLNAQLLQRWAKLAGLGYRAKREITGHFTNRLPKGQGYDAINGWGSAATPSVIVNSSKDPISFLTLTVPARGVTVHPSPTLESFVAWRSPFQMQVNVEGLVADADNKCGNGATWRVELQSESGTAVLARGVIENGRDQQFPPKIELSVRKGDIISLIVNPRDGSHACDTTHVELKMTEIGGQRRVWDLATDVVDRILESNPLPDSYGNIETWHFGALHAVAATSLSSSTIVPGSTLSRWRTAVLDGNSESEVRAMALTVQNSVTTNDQANLSESDRAQRAQLLNWRGPLRWILCGRNVSAANPDHFGIDPAMFGKHPDGRSLPATHLCLQAPHVLELKLPASLVAGSDFVTSATLHAETARHGTVQLQIATTKPERLEMSLSSPILVGDAARPSVESALNAFRNLFPEALCYARIVPVDEVVTLNLFYREDDHLKRLMLSDNESAELDRLWDELFFVAREPLQLAVSYEQLYEFATQDRPDIVKALEPLRKPLNERADKFRERMRNTEHVHVHAVLQLADRAWRRQLSVEDHNQLRNLYGRLRDVGVDHDDAIQLTLARVLTSPNFIYRREEPGEGAAASPVSDDEIATRLSYFLRSSLPDDELRKAADNGLKEDSALLEQTRRMLQNPRTRRLAIQFACQWLHLRNFDQNDEKNEKLYPEFATLRSDMYEETVRFFEDMFRNNGSILDLLNADHTFLNEELARHYGIKFQKIAGQQWQKVGGARAIGRGGILGMATFLASQSGASRTSPILRGNWVSETLLGEELPKPPPGVPQLPEEVPTGLTARQLIEKHSSSPECAICHERIDPYGFALEQYDVLGRLRAKQVDTKTTLPGGEEIEGITGLRNFLLTQRRDDIVRQFCRKLLGFALGREVQLSDEVLLAEMKQKLEDNSYRFSIAVEAVVTSDQFRKIRGREFSTE